MDAKRRKEIRDKVKFWEASVEASQMFDHEEVYRILKFLEELLDDQDTADDRAGSHIRIVTNIYGTRN